MEFDRHGRVGALGQCAVVRGPAHLGGLIGRIYDAAMDENLWPEVMGDPRKQRKVRRPDFSCYAIRKNPASLRAAPFVIR